MNVNSWFLNMAGFFKKLIDNRKEIKMNKHDLKFTTQQVAYQNGIDPKAALASAVSSSVGSLANAASSMYGGGMKPGMNADQLNSVYGGRSGGNITYLILAVLGIYFITKKR